MVSFTFFVITVPHVYVLISNLNNRQTTKTKHTPYTNKIDYFTEDK